MMRGFIFVKVPLNCSINTYVQCSNFRSPVISAKLTDEGQRKTCSDVLFCAWSRTSGSTVVFLTFMQFCCQRLQSVNYCSYFQIQVGILHLLPQALSFRNFHWKSERFHGPHVQYGWIPLDLKPFMIRI